MAAAWKQVLRAMLIGGAVATAAPAWALPTQWILEEIPGPVPRAINASGQVVGGDIGGWLYFEGVRTSLPMIPRDINDLGQVIGNTPFGDNVPMLYENGTTTQLPLWQARAINNTGQVAGILLSNNGRAALFDQTGLRELGGEFCAGQSTCSTYATDLNDLGQVVGRGSVGGVRVPLLFEGESFIDLTTRGFGGEAIAINNHGAIVGFDYESERGVLLENGRITYFDEFDDFQGSTALAINNHGQVVGQASTSVGDGFAWIYDSGEFVDLNTFDILSGDGWTLLSASGINDAGQIIGAGLHGFTVKSFLLTPVTAVPEPQTYLSMALGLLLLVGVARRNRRSGGMLA